MACYAQVCQIQRTIISRKHNLAVIQRSPGPGESIRSAMKVITSGLQGQYLFFIPFRPPPGLHLLHHQHSTLRHHHHHHRASTLWVKRVRNGSVMMMPMGISLPCLPPPVKKWGLNQAQAHERGKVRREGEEEGGEEEVGEDRHIMP